MDVVAYIVRDAAPNYFASVPIPQSFGGFADLTGNIPNSLLVALYTTGCFF